MDYNVLEDESLCALAKSGDNLAYNALEKRYKGLILNSIRSLFIYGEKRGAGKDDLFQEARMGFLNAVRNYNASSPFSAFAKLCVHTAVVSAIRKNNKKGAKILNFSISLTSDDSDDMEKSELVIASLDDPETDYIKKESYIEISEKVKEALSRLEYEILQKYLKGKSYLEIAKELSKNEKAIDNAIQRTRKKIKNIFNAKGK